MSDMSKSSLRNGATFDSSTIVVSQLGIVIGDDMRGNDPGEDGSHQPFGALISTSTHSFSKLCKSPRGEK